MNHGTDASVGLLPDSTGKKVRTIEVVTVIDGVATTVEMQVLTIADGNGNVIDNFATYNLQQLMVAELTAMKLMLQRFLGLSEFDVNQLVAESGVGVSR